MRSRRLALAPASLPIWSCSVWGLPCLPPLLAAAVRSYRTFSPLPRGSVGRPRAVCSLWHWPSTGLDARVPDVIRHTALRSSDFPPPEPSACASDSGSDRPVLLPALVYRESSIRWPARQSPTNFLHRASAFRHPFAYGQAVSGEPVFAPSRHQALEVRKH